VETWALSLRRWPQCSSDLFRKFIRIWVLFQVLLFHTWNSDLEVRTLRTWTCDLFYLQFYSVPFIAHSGSLPILLRCSLRWPDNILIIWIERWQNHCCLYCCEKSLSFQFGFSHMGFRYARSVLIRWHGTWLLFSPRGACFFVCFYRRPWDLSKGHLHLKICMSWAPLSPCITPTVPDLSLCYVETSGMNQTFLELAMLLCPVWGELILFLVWAFCSITDDSILPDLCKAWRASDF